MNFFKICCLTLLVSFVSCQKSKELQADGIKLPGMPTKPTVYSGYHRVKLSFITNVEHNRYYRIFWDDRKKFKQVDPGNKIGETLVTFVDNLEEGNHKFEIVNYDNKGDSSTVIVRGKVYGDKYISSLQNREVKNVTFVEGEDPYVNWGDPAKNEVGIDVTYVGTDGKEQSFRVDSGSIYSTIPNYKENTVIHYTSLYVPESGNIDTVNYKSETIPSLVKEIPESAFTRYVAPVLKGNGDGKSAVNAVDFLDADFWKEMQSLLNKGSVTVKFTTGNYSRAYSEKSLTIDKMGHAQHRLLLEGVGTGTVFTAENGLGNKTVMMLIRDSQNITVRNFKFTGDGNIQYVLRILGTQGKPGLSKNILIENCSWTDMRGIVYGATGAHYTSENITYKGCKFYRIGINHASHMIYNAYGAKHVKILNSHFEDCTGDFVRYRDNCDYGMVQSSTFLRNPTFPTNASFSFISIPLFNDVNPGDEQFATNYSFISNVFTNGSNYAFTFYHEGYSPLAYSYLLTKAEGTTLESGTVLAKKALLLNNFGIDVNKIRLNANRYDNVAGRIVFGSTIAYGAVSKGWTGAVNITNLFNENNAAAFSWEAQN